MENGFIESFNGRLRDECLNGELFLDLLDARRKLATWRQDYNEKRPHSSIGNLTPIEYAQSVREKEGTPRRDPQLENGPAFWGRSLPQQPRSDASGLK
jgi:transposase InsO family protein